MRKYLPILIGLIVIPACAVLPGLKPTPAREAGDVETASPAPTSTPTIQQPTPEPQISPVGEAAPPFSSLRMFTAGNGWAVGASPEAASQIFRTIDGGYTWVHAGPPQGEAIPDGYNAHAFFLDPEHAWVTYYPPAPSAQEPLPVWHTADGGASWSPGFAPPANQDIPDYAFEALFFTDSRNGWLMLAHSPGAGNAPVSLFRSEDAGVHWVTLLDPFGRQADRLHTCCRAGMLFLDTLNGLVAYGGGPYTAPMVHVTRDGGSIWNSQELPPTDREIFSRSACGSGSLSPLGGKSLALVVACFDAERPAPIALPYLYVSDDAGMSWRSTPLPDELARSGPLARYRREYKAQFIDAQYGWLFVQDEDWEQGDPPPVLTHIYQSQDGGLTWVEKVEVDWIGEFSFIDPLNGWAITHQGNDLGLLRTRDGGGTWRPLNPILQPE